MCSLLLSFKKSHALSLCAHFSFSSHCSHIICFLSLTTLVAGADDKRNQDKHRSVLHDPQVHLILHHRHRHRHHHHHQGLQEHLLYPPVLLIPFLLLVILVGFPPETCPLSFPQTLPSSSSVSRRRKTQFSTAASTTLTSKYPHYPAPSPSPYSLYFCTKWDPLPYHHPHTRSFICRQPSYRLDGRENQFNIAPTSISKTCQLLHCLRTLSVIIITNVTFVRNDLLPIIPSGESHFTSKLSVRVEKGPDFVATNFTFFDCNTYSSCTSCVSSLFPCDWCVDGEFGLVR